ncbi:MAG TPA: hypothetical protein EYG03_09290 [Planctomycetes bacterium]|nr:hypothetical protein [Planctomycetota bacterium]
MVSSDAYPYFDRNHGSRFPIRLMTHEIRSIKSKRFVGICRGGTGVAGPGLIAQVVVGKFGDHLPLYRQEDIFVRHGLHLARSTLCDGVSAAADLLEPLYNLQRKLVLESAVMWTDDTPVKVLAGGDEGSRLGRFWTYVGDDEHPYSVYDFTMSRRRDGPQTFLQGFRGYLQADAYGGYDAIFLNSGSDITEVACWAHARRKFFDARANYPREAHHRWNGFSSYMTLKIEAVNYLQTCAASCVVLKPTRFWIGSMRISKSSH